MGKSIKVYGEGKHPYDVRQKYIDNKGNEFIGHVKEAREYFRNLYPSLSIIISYYPRKRK